MNKSLLTIILILLACLLSACGRAPTATPEPVPTDAQTPEPVVGATAEPTAAEPGDAAPFAFGLGGDGVETLGFEAAAEKIRADGDAVYLFATNVGKGDALILRVGNWVGLIDTGKTWARGRVDNALGLMSAGFASTERYRLDAVFITHTDDDHTGGLKWMTAGSSWLPSRTVDAVYASAMYTGVKEEKHPAVKAAEAFVWSAQKSDSSPYDPRGKVTWLKRGDEIPLGDTGAVLKVLAPNSLYQDKDDNNSLVMLLESPQGKILLTGDMELPEEAELLSFGDDLECDVLKVANHGDDDTTSAAFANACAAQVAVISTDGAEKPGTPDAGVVSRLEAAGSRVVVTEDSGAGILVTLKGGVATASYVDFWSPLGEYGDVYIASLDVEDDRIVLGNRSGKGLGLGLMYLYSDKGDELYVIPDGAWIDAGGTLTVGTNSTKGDYDLLWDDKKVINKKKADAIYLYDTYGRLIDWMGNGF